MAVTTFTLPYVGTPPYFSGTATSSLVPNTFPVGIDGRPYMIDQKSGKFQRGYEQRVRDSQDTSTAPGEAAINPGGLWRRGQDSWHRGAGQTYADTAESIDSRFYKSKGIDPWTKGQLSLLNTTKVSLESANTNLHMCVVEQSGTFYLYVADGGVVKFSSNPFDATPTWTAINTAASGSLPTTAITGLETNGQNVYIAWTSHDIWYTTPGSTTATYFYPTSGTANQTYYAFGYAKGRGFAAVGQDLYQIGVGSGSHTVFFDNPDATFRWVGAAAGQNAVYAAGHSGAKSLVYKITIKTDGTLDVPVVALELPLGEVCSSIYGYLGFIVIGTDKGVRFCSTDADNNLVAGLLIPTTGAVNDFTSDGRFVWFTYTNYDGVSSGLGRMDLSTFTTVNTPAYATDLMYTNTADVKSCTSISGKRVFSIAGVGVVVENTASLVASGEIETGTWRWGIPDRKFVAKVDTRAKPLLGSITSYLKTDDGEYLELGEWDSSNDTENVFDGTDNKAIEASFKFVLTRSATVTSGPTLTRWMARAYVAPYRSQVFVVPIILHRTINVKGKDYYLDVESEQAFFDGLIESPRIVTLQIGTVVHTAIVEDVNWESSDSQGNTWQFDGTLVVTLRSVEN